MSSLPTRPRAGEPTDYSSKDYWVSRFERERNFEWLIPSTSFIPHLIKVLNEFEEVLPKIVHVGCGNSNLSLELRQLVEANYKTSGIEIINVDYAAPALERMKLAELAQFGDTSMRWEVLDLLDWSAVKSFLAAPEPIIIMDKACADAIACGQDVETSLCSNEVTRAPPVEVLALHLAALAAPESRWIVMSSSSSRFDFIVFPDKQKLPASEFWQLERTERIVAQSGTREGIHTPTVYHILFILKRIGQKLWYSCR